VASDRASLSRPAYACVERRILRRIPDLADKVTAGDIDAADVIQVEADVVLRLVRNPDGYASETDGTATRSAGRDEVVADDEVR
jgi:hypothetical protein